MVEYHQESYRLSEPCGLNGLILNVCMRINEDKEVPL